MNQFNHSMTIDGSTSVPSSLSGAEFSNRTTTEVAPGEQSHFSENPKNTHGSLRSFFHDALGNVDLDMKIDVGSIISNATVFRCIEILCTFVETNKSFVYKIGEENNLEKAKKHPAYRLTRFRANGGMKSGVWRSTMLYHALTNHGGFSEIIRDQRDRPTALLPLDPNMIIWGEINGELYFFATDPTDMAATPRPILNRDMWHIKGISADGVEGLDKMKILREEFALVLHRRKHAKKFYASGAGISGFFMIPDGMNPETYMNFFETIASQTKELQGMGLKAAPLFGDIKFQPMTVNSKEAQLVESMELTPRTIATIFGVPPHWIGDTSRTSLRSLEEENRAALMYTIDPWFTRFEDESDDKLLTEDELYSEEIFHHIDREKLVQGDLKTMNEAIIGDYHSGLAGWKESRIKKKLTTAPKDDTFVLPANIVGSNPTDPSKPIEPTNGNNDAGGNVDSNSKTKESENTAGGGVICSNLKTAANEHAQQYIRLVSNSCKTASKKPDQFDSYVDKLKSMGVEFRNRVQPLNAIAKSAECDCLENSEIQFTDNVEKLIDDEYSRGDGSTFQSRLSSRLPELNQMADEYIAAASGA